MKRVIIRLAAVCVCLTFAQSLRAEALAGANAGANGEDFQTGLDSALAFASDTDPDIGTATAVSVVAGPSIEVAIDAESFHGAEWNADADGDWFDQLSFLFPVSSVTGPLDQLMIEFRARVSWNLESSGNFNIQLQGLGFFYDTIDGLGQDDFGNIPDFPSGDVSVSTTVPFDAIALDQAEPSYYRGESFFYMLINTGVFTGNLEHGNFPTASGDFNFELFDIILHDGDSQIHDFQIESESGESYQFETDTADFDDDGDVDGRDFLAWQRGYGIAEGAMLDDGDANGDGAVNGADLAVWHDQYGEPGHLSGVVSVPEPASIALVLMSTVLLARRTRRSPR